MTVRVTNAGPDADDAARAADGCGSATPGRGSATPPQPEHELAADGAVADRPPVPRRRWSCCAGPGPDGTDPELLFCDNETNTERLYGTPAATPYPKDGINDHVVGGAATVNPERRGTKCAVWYRLTRRGRRRPSSCGCGCGRAGRRRHRRPRWEPTSTASSRSAGPEADEFYAELTPAAASRGRGAR